MSLYTLPKEMYAEIARFLGTDFPSNGFRLAAGNVQIKDVLNGATYLNGLLHSFDDSPAVIADGAMQTLKRFDAKTPYDHERHLTTQWNAVKYGSNYKSLDRFLDSIIFPITAINDMIPVIVLKLHGK